MMRYFFATTLLMALSLPAFSQHPFETIYGVKFGLNHNNLTGKDEQNNNSGYVSTDVYASVFGEMKLSENYRLEYELLFSYLYENNFLEIPFRFKRNLSHKFSAALGPKVEFNINPWEGNNAMILSIDGGIQYGLSKRFFAEARYSYCLYNIYLEDIFGKRNTLRFGIGYRF
jgi:hypothetical protein